MEAENSVLARGRSVLRCTAPKVRDFWIPDNEEVQEKFRCKNHQKRILRRGCDAGFFYDGVFVYLCFQNAYVKIRK